MSLSRRLGALTIAALLGAAAPALAASTPAPQAKGSPPPRLVYKLPHTPLHSEFIVEVNKLGQVTHVRAGKPSKDIMFNTQTYTSALMSYIRTPDGMHAVVGTYKLVYDYNPKTHMIRRGVQLMSRGGVDPNAPGAVHALQTAAARREAAERAAHPHATLPPVSTFGIPTTAPGSGKH